MPEMGEKEGEMPKETFYTLDPEPVLGLTVRWAPATEVNPGQVLINDALIANSGDASGLDRLIQSLKRARRAMRGTTTAADMAVDSFLGQHPDPDSTPR